MDFFINKSTIIKTTVFLILVSMIFYAFSKKKPKDAYGTRGARYKPKHFSYSEFDSPDEKGSGFKMKDDTLRKLDKARDIAGIPIEVNSGFRTPQHNKLVGGSSDSSHMRGYASDIRCNNNNRVKLLNALYQAGFRRFGIGKNSKYIHVDDDPTLPQNTTWGYGGAPMYSLAEISKF